jgi:hypothetical protein
MQRFAISVSALSLSAAVAAGCASAPPPTEHLASAEAAVRAAREVGAERVPTAELQVKLADEEIQKARALEKQGENQRADSMLLRASSDAELALALAREAGMRAEAQRALGETRSHDSSPSRENGPGQSEQRGPEQ